MSLYIPSNLEKYRNYIVLIEGLFVDYTKTWKLLKSCVMFRHYEFVNIKDNNYNVIEYQGVKYTEHGYLGTDKPDVKVLIPIFEQIEVEHIAYKLESTFGCARVKKYENRFKSVKLIFNNLVTINIYKHKLLAVSALYNSLLDENYKVTEITIPISCPPELVPIITEIIQKQCAPYCDYFLVRNEKMSMLPEILYYLGISFL